MNIVIDDDAGWTPETELPGRRAPWLMSAASGLWLLPEPPEGVTEFCVPGLLSENLNGIASAVK